MNKEELGKFLNTIYIETQEGRLKWEKVGNTIFSSIINSQKTFIGRLNNTEIDKLYCFINVKNKEYRYSKESEEFDMTLEFLEFLNE